MDGKLAELKTRLAEIEDLYSAEAVLAWDQATYMPPGGAPARGRQTALLARLAHERRSDAALGHLIDDLTPYGERLPYDSDEAALIRVARRDFERAVRVPPALIAELNEHGAASYQTWTVARPANDFAAVRDNLARTLDLSRRIAECFPYRDDSHGDDSHGDDSHGHIADPLIDYADQGMKAESVRALFADLRAQMVPLLRDVLARKAADDSCLRQHYPEEGQRAFGERVVGELGYDFNRGRQDKTHHPFMTKFSLGDVRITTRYRPDDLSDGLFSTIHEAGHAMYEQGIDPALEATPLANGTSAGVHESQSRLWENVVGRGRPFWQHYFPQLQAAFPAQLGQVSLDTFYAAVNKVQPSVIRTDADQMTYDLHVMIRFDLELALLEGALAIDDLPEAWQARYLSDIGVCADAECDGVLQDVHWFAGVIGGAFQGYTLGNIMSAAFYAAALRANPDIPEQIGRGDFAPLHGWLRENIYRHGSKYTANELVQRVTGGPLSIDPYVAYLRGKFG